MTDMIAKQIEIESVTVDTLREKLTKNAIRAQKEAKGRKDASSLPQGIKFTEALYKEVLESVEAYVEAEMKKRRKSTFFVNVVAPALAAYEELQENKYTRGKFSHPSKLIAWTTASQISGILINATNQQKVTSISREVVRVVKGTYSLGFEVDNNEISGVTQFIRTYLTQSTMVNETHLQCKTVVVELMEDFHHLTTDPEVVHEMVANRIEKALSYKPMIVMPTPHKSLTDASGGFLSISSPLVKERNRHCSYKCDEALVRKLNAFQSTAWDIDADYLEWLTSFESDMMYFDSTPLLTAYNAFARDVNPWIRKATSTLFDLRKERSTLPESDVEGREKLLDICKVIEEGLNDMNARKESVTSKTGKMDAFNATLKLAQEYAQYDEFYLPVHIDDRGRVYTYCSALDFQGNKLAKSLVGSAKKVRLNEEGVRELKIALGACFDGFDKLKYDHRIAATDAHLEVLFDFIQEPTIEKEQHLETLFDGDEFYVGIRLAYELYRHMSDPEYVTGVFAYIDSCSSAIQIQALLQHDKASAELTNIIESEGDKLADAYMIVANSCQHLVTEMAKDNDEDLMAKLTAFININQPQRLV